MFTSHVLRGRLNWLPGVIVALGLLAVLYATEAPIVRATDVGGVIDTDTTWTIAGSPYILTSNLVVTNGVTLTLEPGVEVRGNTGVEFDVLGHLEAMGTATQPITFTSVTNTGPAQWLGLLFDGGTGNLRYATVRYAARLWNVTGIRAGVMARNVLAGEVQIIDSQIRDNTSSAPGSDYGLYIDNSRVTVSNTLFTNNGAELSYTYDREDAPIYIAGASSVVTLTNNTLIGNIRDRIVLASGTLMAHDTTLPRQSALEAYELDGDFTVPPTVTLTVEPGVQVMSYYDLELVVQGRLNALGIATQPITFTSVTNTGPSQWLGILFDGGTGDLRYTTVRYGAQSTNSADIRAGVMVRNVTTGEVRFQNSQIRDNTSTASASAYGLYVDTSRVTLNNTLFTNNGDEVSYTYGRKDAPLYITGAQTEITLTNNTFSGNIRDRIVLAPGALMSHSVTLNRQAALDAYELDGDFTVPPAITLTVEPGLMVMSYNSIELNVKGRLNAIGTSAQPITFTSATDTGAAQWDGLVFDGGTGDLQHATVRYGGSGANSVGARSNIAVQDVLTGAVQLESSAVESIYGGVAVPQYGLWISNGHVTISNTTFTAAGTENVDCAITITGSQSIVALTRSTILQSGHGLCVNGNGSAITMTRNSLLLNKYDAVRSTGVATITVGGAPEMSNDIVGNGGYAINQVASSGLITATYNWWGDPTGPYHSALNPTGKGGQVSSHVLFDPWLTNWTGTFDRIVWIDLVRPRRASPGQTVPYAVTYMNLMTTTVESATLVLSLPKLATYVDSTGGGIYWPQRHQVYWKLGNLTPGGYGTVSARVRFQWGIPAGTRDTALVVLAGTNYSQQLFDVVDYLSYVPQTVVKKTPLTQPQFDAERQSSPDLNTLYTRALASGFVSGTLNSLNLSTGQVVTQAILAKPDLSAITLMSLESGQALALAMDRTSMAIATASEGVTVNLQTGEYQQWRSSAQMVSNLRPEVDKWDCLLNCAVENVGTAILGTVNPIYGGMQQIQVCADFAATGDLESLRSCLNVAPGSDILLAVNKCYQQFKTDPEGCKCQDNKFDCKKVVWGQTGVWKTPCNKSRGVYEPSQAEMSWYCPFCTTCIAGIGGNPMDRCRSCGTDPCPEQPKPSMVVQGPATHSSGTGCDKTCLFPARDPNALYGPDGDLLPGQQVTYTITYENEGAGEAYGVYITDQLAEHFDPATLTLYGDGQYATASRKIVWFIGEVAAKGEPGSQGVVSFTVRLKTNLPGGTPIINQAVVYFPSVPEETPTDAVVNVIQPLVAVPQSVETTYMQPVTMTLQGLDVGGAPLTLTIATPPLYGYLGLVSTTATYTPGANFVGMDYFTFQASNSVTNSRPAEVQITVSPQGDATPPQVRWTEPTSGTVGIVPVSKPIYTDTVGPIYAPFPLAQFSEPLSATTVTTATIHLLDGNGTLVPISVVYDGTTRQMTVLPHHALRNATQYTVTVTGGVKDLAGNSLATNYVWSFRTRPWWIYLPLLRKG